MYAFKAKMHQIRFPLKLRRDPARRAYSAASDSLAGFKDDRQRFLEKVSKKQFRKVYYNANAYG